MATLHTTQYNDRVVLTLFSAGGEIIQLPTRWIARLSSQIGLTYSSNTVLQYAKNLKYLVDWLEATDRDEVVGLDDLLCLLNRVDIEDWLTSQISSGLARSTVRNREVVLREFLKWLSSRGDPDASGIYQRVYPTDKLIVKAPHKRVPKYVSVEEVTLLLRGYLNECERCFAHTLYDTGLRVSEGINLRLDDLPDPRLFPDGLKYLPLYVRGAKGRAGRAKERVAIISRPLLSRIRRYHSSPEYRFADRWLSSDPSKPVFLSATGLPLNYANVYKQLKCAAKRSELNPGKYSPHKLRHGAGYSILRSELGNDYTEKLVLLQESFGHQSISTTEIYTSIPAPLLSRLNTQSDVSDKYEEAKQIYKETFLPHHEHDEERGHYTRT